MAPARHLLVQGGQRRGWVRYLPEAGREGDRGGDQGLDLVGRHAARAVKRAHDLVMSGEGVRLVPAGSLQADVPLEPQGDVGQQVAEHGQRRDGLSQHRRDVPGSEAGAVAEFVPDRVAPLAPAPFGQLEEQFLLAGVVAPHARPVQSRSLGDLGQGEEPDAPEFERDRLGRRQEVLGATRLVLGRPGPLWHPPSIAHLRMRYLGRRATLPFSASLGALSARSRSP
jgi:hypothetical protein